MDQEIIKEMEVGKSILNLIKTLDPRAVIAGGAPRDWYMNKSCNDIDLYIRRGNLEYPYQVEDSLASLGLKHFKLLGHEGDGSYKKALHLLWVFEGSFEGKKINIMVMDQYCPDNVTFDFSLSICKITYNGREIKPSEEFKKTLESKVIILHREYDGNEPHVQKIVQRFPDYQLAKLVEFRKDLDTGFLF